MLILCHLKAVDHYFQCSILMKPTKTQRSHALWAILKDGVPEVCHLIETLPEKPHELFEKVTVLIC